MSVWGGGGGVHVGVPWTPIPAVKVGNDLTANYNATLAGLPIYNSVPAGNLLLPQGGPYKIGSLGVDTNNVGPLVNIKGWGKNGGTTLQYWGANDCILAGNQNGNGAPQYLPGSNILCFGSSFTDFLIDMTNCGGTGGATALHLTDIMGVDTDIGFVDYNWPINGTKPKSVGLQVSHTNFWAEKGRYKLYSYYLSRGMVFYGGSANLSAAGFSMQGTEIDAYIWIPPGNASPGVDSDGCMGMHLSYGTWLYDATIKIRGIAWGDSSLGACYAMYVERSNAGGAFARMQDCFYDIAMEADGNGTNPNTPYQAWLDNVNQSKILRGQGSMRWTNGGSAWGGTQTNSGNPTSTTFSFVGGIFNDSGLTAAGLSNRAFPWLVL